METGTSFSLEMPKQSTYFFVFCFTLSKKQTKARNTHFLQNQEKILHSLFCIKFKMTISTKVLVISVKVSVS